MISLMKSIPPLHLDAEWMTDTIPEIGWVADVLLFSPEMWRRVCDASPVPLVSHPIVIEKLLNVTPAGRMRRVRDPGLLELFGSYRSYLPPIVESFVDDAASRVTRSKRPPCDWCGGGNIQTMGSPLVVRRPASDKAVLFRPRNAAPYSIIAAEVLDWVQPASRLGVSVHPVKCVPDEG